MSRSDLGSLQVWLTFSAEDLLRTTRFWRLKEFVLFCKLYVIQDHKVLENSCHEGIKLGMIACLSSTFYFYISATRSGPAFSPFQLFRLTRLKHSIRDRFHFLQSLHHHHHHQRHRHRHQHHR